MSREAIEVGAFTWGRIQRLYDDDTVTHWQRCESVLTKIELPHHIVVDLVS
jgi:hypothetical protein